MREAVEGVVALTHGADETAEGVDLVVALDGAAVLVDLGDGDLDGTVVLGLDDAVGGAALAGDVTTGSRSSVNKIGSSGKAVEGSVRPYRSTISPRSFSILTVLEDVRFGKAGVSCR